ncbi:hypothetical protein LCGC14_0581560, partial [marine sediment metagenome]
LVSEGERQAASTYCWKCQAVGSMPARIRGEKEAATCPVCDERWLVFTPDYIVDGIIHEAKETRKSRKNGPESAPWWIDQLRTYFAFAKLAHWTTAPYARIVAKWLMGDYGSRKKGWKPKPPQAALDAYRVVFNPDRLPDWIKELHRRKMITEGSEMPPLTGMEEGARSPAYTWECSSCQVGALIDCENYIWDADGKEKNTEVEVAKVKSKADKQYITQAEHIAKDETTWKLDTVPEDQLANWEAEGGASGTEEARKQSRPDDVT